MDPILDNILETLTRISVMIVGVLILIVYFSPKFLFVQELVILEKCDEFLLQYEIKVFLILCYIKSILYLCIRGLELLP